MSEIFEYPDYFARFYDVIYNHIRGSVDNQYFMQQIQAANGKILEIGVGTGRFFIDALHGGADIYGIDISPSMIKVLRKKLTEEEQARVSVEDALTMNFIDRFNLIIAPFRVFSHILSIKDQMKFLNNVYDHLEKGGTFIFDLFIPNLELLMEGMNNVTDFEGEYEPGKKLKRITTSVSDLVNQILNITMRFEWNENNSSLSKEWKVKLRYFFRYELEHLIQRSKLKLFNIYGDYNENLLNKDSKEFVVVCKK